MQIERKFMMGTISSFWFQSCWVERKLGFKFELHNSFLFDFIGLHRSVSRVIWYCILTWKFLINFNFNSRIFVYYSNKIGFFFVEFFSQINQLLISGWWVSWTECTTIIRAPSVVYPYWMYTPSGKYSQFMYSYKSKWTNPN